ncbi:hypothetical protein NE237_026634 [Protea cynaroides]|uniref:RING-type E3 ubiquitin transferase n=1 Tax=Protea cynaroides TaxID=273540 RepID=A0A9Q0K2X4_9MAGN|nr:hypothetical protein NE237_026634 [Protea cynaroides]
MYPSDPSSTLEDTEAVYISGTVMIAAIIVLCLVIVFVFLLHLYAKRRFWATSMDSRSQRERRRFGSSPSPRARTGLEPSFIQSLPVLIFRTDEFVEGLECSVCLSQFSDGEKIRLLPKCNHKFHIDCIDMWFHSHSTCPICRNPVSPESNLPPEEVQISTTAIDLESQRIPTNVLFWGNQVSNSGSGPEVGRSFSTPLLPSPAISGQGRETMVIEIPVPQGFSSMSPSAEESKSPMVRRLRSLKRLLSREEKISPCSSSSFVDIELGEEGLQRGKSQKPSVSDS